MNTMFFDILKKLTAEQGKEALLNPSKCKALLADYTKQFTGELHLFGERQHWRCGMVWR